MINDLTIIIPTHNRRESLIKSIESCFNIFGNNIKIIISDNSDLDYISLNDIFIQYKIYKYINCRKYIKNIYAVYSSLIYSVDTNYVLILEDDDVLINKNLHHYINTILPKYDLISFQGISSHIINNSIKKQIYLNFSIDKSKSIIKQIPNLWKDQFQFGLMYFKTDILKKSFSAWFDNNYHRMFEETYDESVTLIALNMSNDYIHINNPGMLLGTIGQHLSWNNPELSVYSSRCYIDELSKILNMNDDWKNEYKENRLLELKTINNKLTFDNVFNSNEILNIIQEVKMMFNNKIENRIIYSFILNKMHKYINNL